MVDIDRQQQSRLGRALARVRDVIENGTLLDGGDATVWEALWTIALTNLADALSILDSSGQRIAEISDDVHAVGQKNDLSDLINFARNAACHIDTQRTLTPNGIDLRFCTAVGRCSVDLDGAVISCPYEDDIAVYYGSTRIYVRRNVYRAFYLACAHVGPSIPRFPYRIVAGVTGKPVARSLIRESFADFERGSQLSGIPQDVRLFEHRLSVDDYADDNLRFRILADGQTLGFIITRAAMAVFLRPEIVMLYDRAIACFFDNIADIKKIAIQKWINNTRLLAWLTIDYNDAYSFRGGV